MFLNIAMNQHCSLFVANFTIISIRKHCFFNWWKYIMIGKQSYWNDSSDWAFWTMHSAEMLASSWILCQDKMLAREFCRFQSCRAIYFQGNWAWIRRTRALQLIFNLPSIPIIHCNYGESKQLIRLELVEFRKCFNGTKLVSVI